jgi:hypothetical protein
MPAGKQLIRQWLLLKLLDANFQGLTVEEMLQGLEPAWPEDDKKKRDGPPHAEEPA